MRSSSGKVVLLMGANIMAAIGSWGETPRSPKTTSMDVAVIYNSTLANTVPGSNFWMQGGAVQVHAQFFRGLGVVADIAGSHTTASNTMGAGLDMVTATFGPRYTRPLSHGRCAVFGQALVGEAYGLNSVFPTPKGSDSSADSLALQTGGGMNVYWPHRRFALRAVEADWLRTQLPNSSTGTQNSFRTGAGLILKF